MCSFEYSYGGRVALSRLNLCPVVVGAQRVYTSFRPTRYVEAVVAVAGIIVYAGSLDEANGVAARMASILGCRAKHEMFDGIAVPGFVDAHMHLASLGFESEGVDLRGADSIDALKAILAREARRFSGWIYGRGWDQERMSSWPTRYDLDEVVPDKPVVLMRVCGHAAVVNTRALEELGLLKAGRSEYVDYGCDGSPTGILYEEEAYRAYERARQGADSVKLVLKGQEVLLRHGVTMVSAMDVSAREAAGLMAAWRSGLLHVRTRAYIGWNLFKQLSAAGAAFAGLGDDILRFVGIKLYMDGSLGARTAWLREPYSDADTVGKPLLDSKRLAQRAKQARSQGFDVAVHAIGDAALAEALKGLEASRCKCRIEHASLATPDLIDHMSRLGLRVAVQPRFVVSDYWAVERLGDRARWVYPFRTMLSRGIQLGFSSDAPVEPVNPLEGVYAAVTRGALASVTKSESLDVETAMHLYTQGSALVLGETRAGCLEPGCYADVAILESDPLEETIEILPDIRVVATIVGGEVVWRRV